jgi:DNA polymerase IIIc chi subunit
MLNPNRAKSVMLNNARAFWEFIVTFWQIFEIITRQGEDYVKMRQKLKDFNG